MSRKARYRKRRAKDPILRFANEIEVDGPIKPKKSIGALRKAKKTKPRSPDVTGQVRLQRHTLAAIAKDLAESRGEEVVCNIAGWKNHDRHGQYLTVEISPRFVSYAERGPKRGFFDFLDDNRDE